MHKEILDEQMTKNTMGLFYRVSDKELLSVRNKIFKDVGIPALVENGFVLAPFKTSWSGQYNKSIQGYSYQIARVKNKKYLEILNIYILRGEPWIQIYLNIFELFPNLEATSQLKNNEGLFFGSLQNSITKMRLRSDDYKGPPLFYMMFLPEHKLGKFYTKNGFNKEVAKLSKLIEKDMMNIDSFITRWHELHKPSITDWEGNKKE